jgi:hypothetical protein
MTALSFESNTHAHVQIILRYFAFFYVLGLLRDFMSDVFRAEESELAISRSISSLVLAPVATHNRDTHVWM